MATIQRLITKGLNSSGKGEVILRLSLSKDLKIRFKTGVFVDPKRFNNGRFIMPRGAQREAAELRKAEERVIACERRIMDIVETLPRERWTKENFQIAYQVTELGVENRLDFFGLYRDFVSHYQNQGTYKSLITLGRRLYAFQDHVRRNGEPLFMLEPDKFTPEVYQRFAQYLKRGENVTGIDYPDYLAHQLITRRCREVGNNGLSSYYARLSMFLNWLVRNKIINESPLKGNQDTPKSSYGTPFYLTKEERDHIADYDLSSDEELGLARDFFIFQCLVGCRASDMFTLKKSSVVNGALEYVPIKTSRKRKETVKVPLNTRAKAIVDRYRDSDTEKLIPYFHGHTLYNIQIKQICKTCGVTRLVTVINSKTGKPEQKPICDVASSHMARRTFIGLLYKKVKDPNLIGALSGHVEGSKAFTRYREIDDDIRRELVDLID